MRKKRTSADVDTDRRLVLAYVKARPGQCCQEAEIKSKTGVPKNHVRRLMHGVQGIDTAKLKAGSVCWDPVSGASQTVGDVTQQVTTRERSVRTARRKLTDDRLIAFLRAIRNQGNLSAVRMVNDALDAGEGLDAIFYDGDEFGYNLTVTRVTDATFVIEFGCQAGPLAGDGGEWEVAFDPQGRVSSAEAGKCWIS